MQRKRGCTKDGRDYPPQRAYRYTSPYLAQLGDDGILRECPVAVVDRECPQVYDAIGAHAYAEHAGLAALEAPRWLQHALRVIGAEKARLYDLKQADERAKRDARHGASVLRG